MSRSGEALLRSLVSYIKIISAIDNNRMEERKRPLKPCL